MPFSSESFAVSGWVVEGDQSFLMYLVAYCLARPLVTPFGRNTLIESLFRFRFAVSLFLSLSLHSALMHAKSLSTSIRTTVFYVCCNVIGGCPVSMVHLLLALVVLLIGWILF